MVKVINTRGLSKKIRTFDAMLTPMEVTFLGTGTSQGIPVIGSDHPVCQSSDPRDKRLRSSVLISWENFSVVIDCGPDFRQQMLRENCQRLDAILLTHEHNDHILGLDDVRPFYFMQGFVNIYAHQQVFDSLKRRFDYIFASGEKYPGTPTITEFYIQKNSPFQIGNKTVLPFEVMHGSLPVMGFRIDDFTYITDAKTIDETSMQHIVGTKVLVVNALRKNQHASHFTLDEALDFIRKIKPDKAYLTHISYSMGFHEEVQKQLPENVFLAYDGLTITL